MIIKLTLESILITSMFVIACSDMKAESII